ncbi:glycosyltransferase family 39 protein [Bradyrhizobium betae]|uniref:Glycosyltransferase family 39 protein n=1 Tax=Bradyrhizobium betae TaxID=244734 RepID=A0A5P6P7A7_9BRAD|nr:glycosyltransferase family 39 protein [Bradyrhizobium betae]MCS3728883.1 4-amino-4-deoxy-L-arabinose transferase-like glycosyltransferase [Bradyrhizobium betae]QFI74249.1 glycosyltransferase family 39 protein [Bradyrhizobium betae]
MLTTSLPTARARTRTRISFGRFRAWLVASATGPETRLWLVIQLAILHAVLWTFILINLKAAQDVHMDVAEAYGWGQKFLLGYGKHPPLSGWVAGLWFTVFPATDWATYALAMATVGVGMVICWLLSLRVVDARRAFLVVVMLALYPIFNFKGFKYNPDLLQLVTLPLLVLAYLNAFEKRSWQSGIWFGLAGALALMTKYWVLTMIGAIGLAALIHPERMRFLLSPAPWVAIATMAVAMIPHIVWLADAHFVPLTYAGDTYSLEDSSLVHQLVAGYFLHNVALLALPVALAALAMALVPHWFTLLLRAPSRIVTRAWARGANAGVDLSQALNVWIIQIIVAVGPPLGALVFSIYMKTDWGISLFFLVPLALVAIPALRVQRAVLVNIVAIWLVLSVATLMASPWIAAREMAANAGNTATYGARSDLARELTQAWHARFASRWTIVAGTMESIQPMVFYSPDHPTAFVPIEAWDSGLISRDDIKTSGFIGVFDPTDGRLPAFEKWVSETAPNAERIVMTTRRFTRGKAGPSMSWNIYIAPPAK